MTVDDVIADYSALPGIPEPDNAIRLLVEEVLRLRRLAYIGEHHFPELTYKARLDELVPRFRSSEARVAELESRLAAWEPVVRAVYNDRVLERSRELWAAEVLLAARDMDPAHRPEVEP